MAATEDLRAVESVAFERDQQEFALGDTLDIKTGLILASLTFLAILSGDLMKSSGISHVECWAMLTDKQPMITGAFLQWLAQLVSVLAIIVGGTYSVLVLYPRDYDREPPPSKYVSWIADMEKYRADYPNANVQPVTADDLTAARIDNAIANVKKNGDNNKRKSSLMFVAFLCTVISFGANVFTLAIRLF